MSSETGRKRNVSPNPHLLGAAEKAARHAYAPYSHFHVGCAVRTRSGAVYVGCNVENESYPAGVCAERAAVAAMIAAEGATAIIDQILVYAIGPDGAHTACSPCGMCRQFIYELAPDAAVGFFLSDGEFVEVNARELLPHAFHGQLR